MHDQGQHQHDQRGRQNQQQALQRSAPRLAAACGLGAMAGIRGRKQADIGLGCVEVCLGQQAVVFHPDVCQICRVAGGTVPALKPLAQAQQVNLTQGVVLLTQPIQALEEFTPCQASLKIAALQQERLPDEHAWQPFLLQRRYFQTGLAGREFFERLDRLADHEHALREVYLLCLCLGFQGRYRTASNTADLADIRMKHYRLLPQTDPQATQTEARLFPAAYPASGSGAARRSQSRRRMLQRLLLILAPPLIVLVLALIMHTQLTQAVLQFRQTINL